MKDSKFVAVVGAANVDVHGIAATTLQRSDSNPGRIRLSAGGVARNVAENLSRLGQEACLVSAVGHDSFGDFLLRHSLDAGINCKGLLQLDAASTPTYLSVLNDAGDLDVAIADTSLIDRLEPADIEDQVQVLAAAQLVVVDCNLPALVLDWLFAQLESQTIYVDTVSAAKASRVHPHLRAVHTLKASRAEAESLSGLPTTSESDMVAVADWLHGKGVRRVFITLGSEGVFFSDGDAAGIRTVPASRSTIINTGGAGDAFLAGIVRATIAGRTAHQVMNFGLAVAKLTLCSEGACNPEMTLAAAEHVMGEFSDS